MAQVMEWNGINLPAQNFIHGTVNGTAGPGDLRPTNTYADGKKQWGDWPVGGWAISVNGVKNKRSAINWGSLGARGDGNLNGKEFQAVFYMRMDDIGPTVGRRFRFFRAYDTDDEWLITLRMDGRYTVDMTDNSNSIALGKMTPNEWTRFEVSFNRRSGVIAGRMGPAGGLWKRINLTTTMKKRKRLERISLGSHENDSPDWVHFRNILVNDDSYPVSSEYKPPRAPSISSTITSRKIAQNESTSFSATVSQGTAPIAGRWWVIGMKDDPPSPLPLPPYPMEALTKPVVGTDYEVGLYTVKFIVRDTNNFIVTKTFGLTVGDADSPPEAAITFPEVYTGQSSSLTATVTSPGFNAIEVTSVLWTQIEGPEPIAMENPTELSNPVGPFTQAGLYTFEVTLTNDLNLSMTYTVSADIAEPAPPETEVIVPEEDVALRLTGESVNFEAVTLPGSMPIASRTWSTSPTGGIILGQNTDIAAIKFPLADMYSVEYRVTDVLGNTAVAANKIVEVAQAFPPVITFPPDMTLNIKEGSEIFVSAVVDEGSYATGTETWEVVESPNNVGATLEAVGHTATLKDFTDLGFYRIQLTVVDVTGLNTGIGEFQVYVFDSRVPLPPDTPVDPLDQMTNTQLELMVAQRMSGTPDGNTTQIIKRYYLSVVTHQDKYKMSFHQLQREYFKSIVNGDIDVNLALYGVLDGGDAEDPTDEEL